MINKIAHSLHEAVCRIPDGAAVMVTGFGDAGLPRELLAALVRHAPRDLTLISNNAGTGDYGLAALLAAGLVRKVICSYPKSSGADGTPVAEGKEQRVVDGVGYVLEHPLRADFALIKAYQGDRWGNLTYRLAGRSFGPVMAMAAKHSIAQVDDVVPLGTIAADAVHTPGIFIQSVVRKGAADANA